MDGKWNYMPSSDKWMSLWEIEWILQPSLAQVQMWLMENSRFFSVQICAPAQRSEKVTRKKKDNEHVSSSTRVWNCTWLFVPERNCLKKLNHHSPPRGQSGLLRNCVRCLTEEETFNATFIYLLTPDFLFLKYYKLVRLAQQMWDPSVVCFDKSGAGRQRPPLTG